MKRIETAAANQSMTDESKQDTAPITKTANQSNNG